MKTARAMLLASLGALAVRLDLPPTVRPLPRLTAPHAKLEPVGSPVRSSRRSREAFNLALWHDDALERLGARGGYASLSPTEAVELRLRLEVVESWYWRDAAGELLAKPKPFAEASGRELRRWTLPVDAILAPRNRGRLQKSSTGFWKN